MKAMGRFAVRAFVEVARKTFVVIPIVIGGALAFANESGSVDIVFLDVGQGDSILIQQNDVQILIDGGPDASVLFEISKYMPPKDMYIDFVILTHPHADHINGLLEVIDKYEVGEIWINTVEYDVQAYEYLLSLDMDFREVEAGDVLEYADIYVEVLFPFEVRDVQRSNLNNESVVLYAELKGRKIYLTGDAEEGVEEELISEYVLREADILKAGHHCSKTASSEGFLRALEPALAVCSLGVGNRFGHPHDETIRRFERCDVQYMSTKDEGNIVFTFRE